MPFSHRLPPPWPGQPQLDLEDQDESDDLEDIKDTSDGNNEPVGTLSSNSGSQFSSKSNTSICAFYPSPSPPSAKSQANEKTAVSDTVTETMGSTPPQPLEKRPARSPSPPPASKKPCPKKLSSDILSYLTTTSPSKEWLNHTVKKTAEIPPHGAPLTIRLVPHMGDIFKAPPATLLLHACNTQGLWGAGIALAFRKKYPKAFQIYRQYCTRTHNVSSSPVPTGSALLIPPVDGPGHWIGCLFTSARVGRRRDSEAAILQNTVLALGGLLQLVHEVEQGVYGVFASPADSGTIGGVRMCRINSGKFGVPWEKTREVMESKVALPGWRQEMEVWEL